MGKVCENFSKEGNNVWISKEQIELSGLTNQERHSRQKNQQGQRHTNTSTK
jgi:hypothetical protein